MIGAIIIAIIGFIALFIALILNENQRIDVLIIISLILLPSGCMLLSSILTEKGNYIQALKGNNPYKMEIRYELKDSIYIPVDTLYIKIK
jgi:uncharacterized membrane protein YeiB